MFGRVILSFVVLVLSYLVNTAYSAVSVLTQGNVAGDQFANSDAAYVRTMGIFSAFTVGNWILVAVTLGLLVAIWIDPVKKLWTKASADVTRTSLAIILGILILSTFLPSHASAFYSTTDKTEVYSILPNESAFYVPNEGANKDSQVQLDSEAYFKQNKVAAKYFVIPHFKLSGSAGNSVFAGWDFYVPTGRLIVVDRTPQSREWVVEGRGTGKTDESFHCQSKDALNIRVGVAIGASVEEENAAKFLYNFGVSLKSGQDISDPNVVFQSVYFGKSLSQVMDQQVRNYVQTAVCDKIAGKGFDEANDQMVPIMDEVRKEIVPVLAAQGVTLRFIGYADEWHFDDYVQTVVNQAYEAKKLATSINILQEVAQIKVQEGLGSGLDKHGLPMVITPGMMDAIINLGKTAIAPLQALAPAVTSK